MDPNQVNKVPAPTPGLILHDSGNVNLERASFVDNKKHNAVASQNSDLPNPPIAPTLDEFQTAWHTLSPSKQEILTLLYSVAKKYGNEYVCGASWLSIFLSTSSRYTSCKLRELGASRFVICPGRSRFRLSDSTFSFLDSHFSGSNPPYYSSLPDSNLSQLAIPGFPQKMALDLKPLTDQILKRIVQDFVSSEGLRTPSVKEFKQEIGFTRQGVSLHIVTLKKELYITVAHDRALRLVPTKKALDRYPELVPAELKPKLEALVTHTHLSLLHAYPFLREVFVTLTYLCKINANTQKVAARDIAHILGETSITNTSRNCVKLDKLGLVSLKQPLKTKIRREIWVGLSSEQMEFADRFLARVPIFHLQRTSAHENRFLTHLNKNDSPLTAGVLSSVTGYSCLGISMLASALLFKGMISFDSNSSRYQLTDCGKKYCLNLAPLSEGRVSLSINYQQIERFLERQPKSRILLNKLKERDSCEIGRDEVAKLLGLSRHGAFLLIHRLCAFGLLMAPGRHNTRVGYQLTSHAVDVLRNNSLEETTYSPLDYIRSKAILGKILRSIAYAGFCGQSLSVEELAQRMERSTFLCTSWLRILSDLDYIRSEGNRRRVATELGIEAALCL